RGVFRLLLLARPLDAPEHQQRRLPVALELRRAGGPRAAVSDGQVVTVQLVDAAAGAARPRVRPGKDVDGRRRAARGDAVGPLVGGAVLLVAPLDRVAPEEVRLPLVLAVLPQPLQAPLLLLDALLALRQRPRRCLLRRGLSGRIHLSSRRRRTDQP